MASVAVYSFLINWRPLPGQAKLFGNPYLILNLHLCLLFIILVRGKQGLLTIPRILQEKHYKNKTQWYNNSGSYFMKLLYLEFNVKVQESNLVRIKIDAKQKFWRFNALNTDKTPTTTETSSSNNLESLFSCEHAVVGTALLGRHHVSHLLLCLETEGWLQHPPVTVHPCTTHTVRYKSLYLLAWFMTFVCCWQ